MVSVPESELFSVVTNVHGAFSLWPSAKPVPNGWKTIGIRGSRTRCIDEVNRLWPDGPRASGERPYGHRTLIELFADTVVRHPARTAVGDGYRRFSYAELDDRSSALAAELRTRGIGREDHVVVHLDRGVRVFVALLGILKAGAAYVPVDTRYPDARRDLMLQDSRAPLMITEPDRIEQLAGLGVEVYGLELDEPARNCSAARSPAPSPTSTGRLKPLPRAPSIRSPRWPPMRTPCRSGTALAGSSVYLLDERLDEVAQGVVGELHVGGHGVARGYLAQGKLIAERFLPDPFAGAGGRMYATGDLARRGPNGALEYGGRVDDQVKIRGHRVEPREVERVLSWHDEVREAAVLVAGGGSDRHLVALVVSDEQVAPKQLRKYATDVMPDFMVPSSFQLVPEIPANDHGKRDLGQLRQLADEQVQRARTE